MYNIRHILRLYTQSVGFFEIVKQTGILRSTLRKHISDFNQSGMSFEEINQLSDKDLEELFVKPEEKPVDIMLQTLLNLFPLMDKEIKKKRVSRMFLWKEYKKQYPDGYGYSRFNRYFLKWKKSRAKPVMRKEHKFGDKMYIDFAGQKLSIIDTQTGQPKYVEVFVAILGASQFTCVEAVMTQQKEDFIPACENALQFFGGVPGAIVCDNLRSAVKRSNRYEPSINETFADFGEHYNTAIIPTRPYKPTDKASVEVAIKIVYSRIYVKLIGRKFFSLQELNTAIREDLEEYNSEIITGKGYTRKYLFTEKERAALSPLPALRYEFKKQAYITVPKNCHVCLPADKHYYSVPYHFIGKCVKVLYSSENVMVFSHYERIAFHKRDRTPFTYTTDTSHLFPAHRFPTELTSDRFLNKAEQIHPDIKRYLGVILERKLHRDQAYRICEGILGFAKRVGDERLIKACQRATNYGIYNYRVIKRILEKGLDMDENEDEQLKMPEHNNIRGKDYYQ